MTSSTNSKELNCFLWDSRGCDAYQQMYKHFGTIHILDPWNKGNDHVTHRWIFFHFASGKEDVGCWLVVAQFQPFSSVVRNQLTIVAGLISRTFYNLGRVRKWRPVPWPVDCSVFGPASSSASVSSRETETFL